MAIVMPSEAHDCDESEKVLSNRQNLSPNASRGRIVGNWEVMPLGVPKNKRRSFTAFSDIALDWRGCVPDTAWWASRGRLFPLTSVRLSRERA
jgi:hypothetical protein